MRITSPVAYGSGAYVVHKYLEKRIDSYSCKTYNPWVTLFPPLLYNYRDVDASVVHAPLDYALFFKTKNQPLVSTVHGYMLDNEVNKSAGLLKQIHYKTDLKYFINKSIECSDKIICVSDYIKKKLISEIGESREFIVIPNGIDAKMFMQKKDANKKRKFNILFVGNVKNTKGVNLFPELMDILGGEYQLLYTSGLRAKGEINHPLARSVGSVMYKDMPLVYNMADVLICPSIREGFGLVIAEAMACELPIIAGDHSAIPELLDDGFGGYLCKEMTAGVVAERVKALKENIEARVAMGTYNRKKILEKYTVEKMVDAYKKLFAGLDC